MLSTLRLTSDSCEVVFDFVYLLSFQRFLAEGLYGVVIKSSTQLLIFLGLLWCFSFSIDLGVLLGMFLSIFLIVTSMGYGD